mmetsp:Transcript_20376/g.37874  ORF Transcript_20376/g.37874 Transcript_20376/m.37874 type:complete len:504 (+) Transcript_20376:167-1678(+)
MVKKKRQSKRIRLQDKYTVEKRVKEHQRKKRREDRKKARSGGNQKPKKEPALPNLMPFKEAFLRKMMDDKEREKEHERARQRKQWEARELQEEQMMEEGYDDESAAHPDSASKKRKRAGLTEEDLANAASRAEDFEERMEEQAGKDADTVKGKKRMYMKDLRNVVDTADVVLLVLDARDPMGTRAPQAEKMVMEHARNKRLVVVLNKIDLVPKSVAEKWLTILRREYPTVAFRASTQLQKNNLGRATKDSIGLGTSSSSSGGATVGDSVCVGADTLVQLLKNYSRNKGIKTSITVGVVGYPNVGKSSVINSLKRSRAVGVSPTPGHTKSLQIVQLDKKVRLIDSPGVLFLDSTDNDRLVLRNCFDPANIDNVIDPVTRLIEKCSAEQLMILYTLPRFQTPIEFLAALARKRGKLGRGGVPDQAAAARIVLQDWNSGKIPYYVSPPAAPSSGAIPKTSKIVTTWAKEFDLEALMAKEDSELVERLPEDTDIDEFAVVFENSVSV